MQQLHSVGEYDEKLNQMEHLGKIEEQKDLALDALKELKKETDFMVDEALATTRREMNTKDEKALELQLAEKEAMLEKLKEEMDQLRSSEARATGLVAEYKRKFQELETEFDKRKESETNLFDTLVMQTKQLELSKISLEESKIEIASLQEKLKALKFQGITASATTENMKIPDESTSMGIMETEAEVAKNKLTGSDIKEGDEELYSMKAKVLLEELSKLKNELKSATEAEENSKKAMDDLAFALKEVATEANQVKAQLTLSQVELEHTKGDAERWRVMLQSTEEKFKELLDATKKESDRHKNTAERLRLEAEESLLAWNGKETEFVNWIKRAEEERMAAQKETARVLELLNEADDKSKASKEENQKLRDILKQALNEANVAKEAAEIAKAENFRLQDTVSLLAQENEMLKIHEAASFENIKELKRLLSESSIKQFKNEDIMEKEKSSTKEASKEEKEQGKKTSHSKNLSKTFSFNLKDMIIPHKQQQQQHKVENNEEPKKETDEDALLRGSIFDEAESSDSESHHDGEIEIPDDFDHLDESHFDDPDERNSKKRRALLRRFGDLIRRKNYSRKDMTSNEEHLQT